MTLDALGAAINLFETNLRTDGMELIFQKLFSPEGHFPNNNIMELFDAPRTLNEEGDISTETENNRLPRSSDNLVELDTVDRQVS